jgi:phosphoribosylformimino-5-aminoimidazole carboxamide ribotide isomerase
VGASHVIVTSYVFKDGELDQRRLDVRLSVSVRPSVCLSVCLFLCCVHACMCTSCVAMCSSLTESLRAQKEILAVVGKECLVLDLSCRRKPNSEGIDEYFVVTDRWQKFTSLRVDESTLRHLATFCDEFLVHGVDVEGTQTGLELPLLEMLGQHSPIRVTYAGGARDLSDCETVARLGSGRVGLTVGSALDIFGGELPFAQVLAWHKSQQALGPPTSSSESTAPARL